MRELRFPSSQSASHRWSILRRENDIMKHNQEDIMDFIKLDSRLDEEQLGEMFSRVLHADTKGNS